jgi:hypothetical protein
VTLNNIPADEFRASLAHDRLFARSVPGDSDFDRGFVAACEKLARAFAEDRGFAEGKRLPVGPLRALVERVGVEEFRALARRLGPNGKGAAEVVFRRRDAPRPAQRQRRAERLQLELWGALVLSRVAEGELLGDARQAVAELLGWHCRSTEQRRSLEQRWRELGRLCRARGFGPRLVLGGPPYPLSALVGRRGRRPKNSRKNAAKN